jgi:hypothetical protein
MRVNKRNCKLGEKKKTEEVTARKRIERTLMKLNSSGVTEYDEACY